MKAQAYRQTFGFTVHGSEAKLSTKNVEITVVKIAMIYFYLFIYLLIYLFTHYGKNVDSVIEKIYVDLW